MSKLLAVLFVLTASVIGSIGMLFFKKGAKNVSLISIKSLVSLINKQLIAAVILFFISFFVYILALRHERLTFIFPFVSLSYIWVILLARLFLKEKITKNKVVGILMIILGVMFTSLQ